MNVDVAAGYSHSAAPSVFCWVKRNKRSYLQACGQLIGVSTHSAFQIGKTCVLVRACIPACVRARACVQTCLCVCLVSLPMWFGLGETETSDHSSFHSTTQVVGSLQRRIHSFHWLSLVRRKTEQVCNLHDSDARR